MKKRLATLILLLVLGGSTFAGVPLHFGESECGMTTMSGMDCCKAALMQSQTPEVAEAKLCCALNCAQNGSTSPPTSVRIPPPTPAGVLDYPPIPQPMVHAAFFHLIDSRHGPPGGSPPAYLLNLTLLI
jgi:hypothetical protein